MHHIAPLQGSYLLLDNVAYTCQNGLQKLPFVTSTIFSSALLMSPQLGRNTYYNIPISIGRQLAAWLAAWVFSQAVRVSTL